MSVVQVLEELKKMKMEVKYRETVYRALEKLLDVKLVEKFYVKEKGLCYKATINRVIINIAEGKVEREPAI
jgi:Fe2+ or Zn2+ uptake regulation protein